MESEDEEQASASVYESKRARYTQRCEVCDTQQPEETMRRDRGGWHCRNEEACHRRIGKWDVAPPDGDLPLGRSRLLGSSNVGHMLRRDHE